MSLVLTNRTSETGHRNRCASVRYFAGFERLGLRSAADLSRSTAICLP
jgi:hypothetical protein